MTNQTIEPQVNWSPDMMVEVILNEPDDFLWIHGFVYCNRARCNSCGHPV